MDFQTLVFPLKAWDLSFQMHPSKSLWPLPTKSYGPKTK